MTPEERAAYMIHAMALDAGGHGYELRPFVVAQIRDAIGEEREACATLLESFVRLLTREDDVLVVRARMDAAFFWRQGAAAIRARTP